MMIQLKSFTKDAASRTKGLQLKTKLEHAIKEERNISVDFDGIDKFASPFFNNSFSALGIQYGFGTIEKIELLNISDICILGSNIGFIRQKNRKYSLLKVLAVVEKYGILC